MPGSKASRSAPEISVVIPTRNREMRLRFMLEALTEQTLDRERFEVVVVRATDAQGPFTEAPPGLDVRFLSHPNGPAAQRNAGWRAARGNLVVFTDDDCRPTPGWLASLLAADDGGEAILQGRTEPDPDEAHLLHGRARSVEITTASDWSQTCNIAYPRALLERVGGFDESFPTAWCEDTDLGMRARRTGAEHRFVSSALAYHAVHARTFAAAVREAARRDAMPTVVARHPELRRGLFLRVFERRAHAQLLLAIAGLVVARRSRLLGALAVYPYVMAPRRTVRPLKRTPLTLMRVPGRAIIDLVSVLAIARAAIRSRVLVL